MKFSLRKNTRFEAILLRMKSLEKSLIQLNQTILQKRRGLRLINESNNGVKERPKLMKNGEEMNFTSTKSIANLLLCTDLTF